MRALQIVAWAAEIGSFALVIVIGGSITKDVNESLGESNNGIWSARGNKIWKDHEQLFPASRKRLYLVAALLSSFAFLIAGAYLVR
jgi:hypothetical protein